MAQATIIIDADLFDLNGYSLKFDKHHIRNSKFYLNFNLDIVNRKMDDIFIETTNDKIVMMLLMMYQKYYNNHIASNTDIFQHYNSNNKLIPINLLNFNIDDSKMSKLLINSYSLTNIINLNENIDSFVQFISEKMKQYFNLTLVVPKNIYSYLKLLNKNISNIGGNSSIYASICEDTNLYNLQLNAIGSVIAFIYSNYSDVKEGFCDFFFRPEIKIDPDFSGLENSIKKLFLNNADLALFYNLTHLKEYEKFYNEYAKTLNNRQEFLNIFGDSFMCEKTSLIHPLFSFNCRRLCYFKHLYISPSEYKEKLIPANKVKYEEVFNKLIENLELTKPYNLNLVQDGFFVWFKFLQKKQKGSAND